MKNLLVHGYDSEPGHEKHGPGRSGGQFEQWENGVFKGIDCVRFAWDSALLANDFFRAICRCYAGSYHLAYKKLSVEAGLRLSSMAHLVGHHAFGHSLGTKVIIEALKERPAMFERVIFCNGAVLVKDALPVIEQNPEVEFLNIACREDDTLDKAGARFANGNPFTKARCIGNGLETHELPDNLQQVILDDYETQARYAAKGYDIQGDDPDDYGDHSYSFEHEGNWPIFQFFLDTGRLPA